MGQSKVILLLCYEFPPYPSIGGRRWAKFAKYLARDGHTIHVIAAQGPFRDSRQGANWVDDIASPNIFIYYIKSHYPYQLLVNKSSIAGRLLRKLYASFLEYTGKGIIQDKAIFWQQGLLKTAKKLIVKHRIQNIISTGPPHRVNYYATLLKREFPTLNIICDFRDTWLDGKVYGLKKISRNVLEVESHMESYTVNQADYLLFTYQPMLQDFVKRYPHLPEDKFKHFPHNYDMDDYPITESKQEINHSLSFIFGGTITATAVTGAFIPFFKAVKQLQEVNYTLYKRLNIVIYGSNNVLANAIKEMNLTGTVKFLDPVPEKQFYSEAAKSNYLLSFLGADWKDFVTTKNIAYLPIRKPIILISKSGVVSDFIEINNLGFIINPETCFDDLCQLLKNTDPRVAPAEDNDAISIFSYENAAEKLLRLMK